MQSKGILNKEIYWKRMIMIKDNTTADNQSSGSFFFFFTWNYSWSNRLLQLETFIHSLSTPYCVDQRVTGGWTLSLVNHRANNKDIQTLTDHHPHSYSLSVDNFNRPVGKKMDMQTGISHPQPSCSEAGALTIPTTTLFIKSMLINRVTRYTVYSKSKVYFQYKGVLQ